MDTPLDQGQCPCLAPGIPIAWRETPTSDGAPGRRVVTDWRCSRPDCPEGNN